ncbi:uncharacterized protein LOC144343501 [Saccoglossus kowalevskii]
MYLHFFSVHQVNAWVNEEYSFFYALGFRNQIFGEEQNKISALMKKSFLEQEYASEYEKDWKLQKTEVISNVKLLSNFLTVKLETDREEELGFVLLGSGSCTDLDRVCNIGKIPLHSFDNTLGDPKKGMNLLVHADVCLKWAKFKNFDNPKLLVYKENVFGVNKIMEFVNVFLAETFQMHFILQ